MIGRVAYSNPSRRFCLLTPFGKTRDYDIFCHEIQFDLAEIDPPYFGQIVEFSVTPDSNGQLEATDLQIPKSDLVAAGIDGGNTEAGMSGAIAPAAAFGSGGPAAGVLSGGR